MPIKTQSIDKIDNGTNGHARRSEAEWSALEQAGLVEGAISEDGKMVSEEEYWADYYNHPDFDYEWNNGILEAKPMSDFIKYSMYDWFVAILREFLRVNPVARKMALEVGFRLEMSDKTTVRKPDLFIVRNDNPVALGDTDRQYYGICDLCIESISDSSKREIERDTVAKKQEYAAAGVREYFILDPSGQHMAFYRLTLKGAYVAIDGGPAGVICSEVLPSFQFRIEDLYRQPQLVELIDDEVYRDYVLLEYQEERARAEQECARAEQERARAERLAAKLRQLGIDADAG
jgi:Uma2 family endonuclease